MYNQTAKLQDNEVLQKVNKETGEVTEVPFPRKRNPNIDRHDPGTYTKHFSLAWKTLYTQTTKYEYAIAAKMSTKIRMITNSLEPLSDETTLQQLSNEFGVSMGKVKATFEKLFNLGVYGKFEVVDWENEEFRHKRYWVFNPFLSCNGNSIDNRSKGLFSKTLYAQLYKKEDQEVNNQPIQ